MLVGRVPIWSARFKQKLYYLHLSILFIWVLTSLSTLYSHSTSEVACSNLSPGTSYWKVGHYLPMPGGLTVQNLDQLICTGFLHP